jgi:hypothetical protein
MSDRNFTPETVEDYFRAGSEAAFVLSAQAHATLEIDPPRQELRLIVPAVGATPELAAYERISAERVDLVGKGGEWFRLTVDAIRMHYEAYSLIVSIVDQLEGGASFRQAVSESLVGLRNLLSSRRRLSETVEAGLIGELLVLGHVIDRLGEVLAVTSWLGPMAEEHDFGFEAFDAEVKTTRSESRTHVIGSDTQLEPVLGRPLFLISIQITLAGVSDIGFTLPELIDLARARVDQMRAALDVALDRIGWSDSDADLYPTRFVLRSQPRALLVDAAFPAITSQRLDTIVPQRNLVSAVSYRIDVSHLPAAMPPAPLDEFCEAT